MPTDRELGDPRVSATDELRSLLDGPGLAELDGHGDIDPQRVLEDLEAQQQRLDAAQRELEATEFTMQSGDGLLEVTVRGGASITGLTITPDALGRYSAEELGRRLVALIGEAMAHGATLFREAFSEVFDRPADLDAVLENWPGGGSVAPPAGRD